MSIDMSQFHEAFFEEGHEHLDELERVLMEIDVTQPDSESLDSIFRAAHSIKGGSGIFGFDALGSVTHVMENLLDRFRSREMVLTREWVDLLLATSDTLRSLLEAYRQKQAIDWARANQATEALEQALSGHAGPAADAVDQGFGFFEVPVQPSAAEEAFGFFDDESSDEEAVSTLSPATASSSPADDESFGFFEPEAAQDGETDQPAADTAPQDAGVSDDAPVTQVQVAQASAVAQSKNPTGLARPAAQTQLVRESSSIRVDIGKIDQLVNLVGELVITQSMVGVVCREVDGPLGERIEQVLNELERNTRELQESIMSVRMMPVSFVFNRFPRVVRDLAAKMQKSIDLRLEGGDAEMDKSLIEKLVDPLTHLVRNSIDHGIESPELRRARSKPETGTVTLRAVQKGGNIVIEVEDDGGGLNREKILAKARESGLSVPENPTDDEVWPLILEPGFSTAETVTDVSGRGVGMDVVKRNLESLGGRLDIESTAGEGSRFIINLPLTLAIIDGMGLKVGEQSFILPMASIVESMRPDKSLVRTMGRDDYLLSVRGQYWPVVALYSVMDAEPRHQHPSDGIVVLIESGRRRFALLVDELLGQQQVVIKSLEKNYKRVPGIAGATIMGDGSVAMIIDVESLAGDLNLSQIEGRLAG